MPACFLFCIAPLNDDVFFFLCFHFIITNHFWVVEFSNYSSLAHSFLFTLRKSAKRKLESYPLCLPRNCLKKKSIVVLVFNVGF
jgi:hypothetical protein